MKATGTKGADGIDATSDSSNGVLAKSQSGTGVLAESTSGIGVHAVGGGASPAEPPPIPQGAILAEGGPNIGVYATSSSHNGVNAISGSANGVNAFSTSGAGVNAFSEHFTGVNAESGSGTGVNAESDSGTAVNATSGSGTAVNATSGSTGTGVNATSGAGIGVHAVGGGASPTEPPPISQGAILAEGGPHVGVYATSSSDNGVQGMTTGTGAGVTGSSAGGNGVQGSSADLSGVWGNATGTGAGVTGSSAGGNGVQGMTTGTGAGVTGSSAGGNGVQGSSADLSGVWGNATGTGAGVTGSSAGGNGVQGMTTGTGVGVIGSNSGGGLAGSFQGNVQVTGTVTVEQDIVLSNADCAEEFDVSSPAGPESGTVMVIGDDQALHPSSEPYDRRVAGVVSGAGDYKSALLLDRRASSRPRSPVALVGKVCCKVDAQHGPVNVGDLLTTSPRPGHAMRAADQGRAFGAVIGKALQPLASGQGLIAILVALQ